MVTPPGHLGLLLLKADSSAPRSSSDARRTAFAGSAEVSHASATRRAGSSPGCGVDGPGRFLLHAAQGPVMETDRRK